MLLSTNFPTHIALRNTHSKTLPTEFAADDVRLSETLVEIVIDRFSKAGDIVFDPFAGYRIVLAVAERRGRAGYGLEIDDRRAAYARSQLTAPGRMLTADARQLLSFELPHFDLSLSSPPYMCRGDLEDPFSGYKDPRERLRSVS